MKEEKEMGTYKKNYYKVNKLLQQILMYKE